MKILICVFLMVLCCSCATVGVDDEQRAIAHYKLGVSHLNDNNVKQAFIEFQKALEYNPNDRDVLNAIGIIYLLKYEEYQKAIDFFTRAAQVDPNFSEAYNNLGKAYEKKERFNEAVGSYKKALSNLLYTTPEKAYYNLGMAYYRLGSYDEAIDAFKDAVKRVPDFYYSYYGIALCYNAKGAYGDAAIAMTGAIEMDPLYRGDKSRAIVDLKQKKLKVKGFDEKDIGNYLEILKY